MVLHTSQHVMHKPVSNKHGLQGSMHWSRLFTRMITDKTKLVGPTITCSNPPSMSVNDTMPYVQFNALATDKVRSLVSHFPLASHCDTKHSSCGNKS